MFFFAAENAPLVVECRTVVNKTTGRLSFQAEWFIDGLEVDVAAVDHYTVIADWVAQFNHLPIHIEGITAQSNISVSKVSSLCKVLSSLCGMQSKYLLSGMTNSLGVGAAS